MTTIELIKSIVDSLVFSIVIDNVINNGNGTYTLEVGADSNGELHTYHLAANSVVVTILSKQYRVVAIVNNVSVTVEPVSGDDPMGATSIPVPVPNFKHGTTVDVNGELDAAQLSSENFPMVYLLERFSENYSNVADSMIDRTPAVRLFCLDVSKKDDWTISNKTDYVIRPMVNLANEVMNAFDVSGKIGLIDDFSITNIPNFGIFNANQGETQQIFDQYCSGAELNVSIPIEIEAKCLA